MSEEKDKGGRPQYEVDYETLDELCKIFCTGEEAAAILGVDYDTLNKALIREKQGGFTDYFKKASSEGRQSLRRKQYDVAVGGSVPMLIWLGKQFLDQKDKSEVDSTVTSVELIAPIKPSK